MSRRLPIALLIAAHVAVILGCSGVYALAGYGEERAAATVRSGQPFSMTLDGTGAPLDVWFVYEAETPGKAAFGVDGALEVRVGTGPTRRSVVHVAKSGAPVFGQRNFSIGRFEVESPSGSTRRETRYLLALDPVPPGERISVKGTLAGAGATRLVRARVVVTD